MQFTKDLLKVAPKAEDDFAVKPNRFGVVPQKKGIHPVVNENMDDLDNDDDILLQTGGDWTPQGQPGLAAEISKSREKEEADEVRFPTPAWALWSVLAHVRWCGR